MLSVYHIRYTIDCIFLPMDKRSFILFCFCPFICSFHEINFIMISEMFQAILIVRIKAELVAAINKGFLPLLIVRITR